MLIKFYPDCKVRLYGAAMNIPDRSKCIPKRTTSPDVTTSISEFLEQERLCKELCNTIASDGMSSSKSCEEEQDKRCDSVLNISDLSDDDIGSILEKMNQIMSPSKSSQGSESGDISACDSKGDRNIEEILQEAEVLMQESLTLEPSNVVNKSISNHSATQHTSLPCVSAVSNASIRHHSPKKTGNICTKPKINRNGVLERTKDFSVNPSKTSVNSLSSSVICDQLAQVNERNLNLCERRNLNQTYLVEGGCDVLSGNRASEATSKDVLPVKKQFRHRMSADKTGRPECISQSAKDVCRSINARRDGDEEKCHREYLSKGSIEDGRDSVRNMTSSSESVARKTEEIYEKINEEIRVEIEQVLKSKEAKLEGLGTPIDTPTLNGNFPNIKLSYPGLETPSGDVPGCFNLEEEFLEERKRCLKLKADLEWIGSLHMEEVSQLQKQHDEEMFSLKKEIVVLTSQLSERVTPAPAPAPAPAPNPEKESERHQVEMLEKELAEQEAVLASYQRENEALCAELRSVKRLLKKLMSLLKKET